MGIQLFHHNMEAYKSATAMLAEKGKAAVIHPTGTGKSFIGFKLCEDNPDKTICWLSPSEYIFKTQLENLAAVSEFWQPENIKFYTYTKLMMMSDKEMQDIQPDMLICDEYHRLGTECWGKAFQRLLTMYPNVQMLGLSATNIRYLDNQRDMAEELFDSNICSEMTLGEALALGILNPPKYIMSIFSYQQELDKYLARVKNAKSVVRDKAEKYFEALRRALEKADGLDEIFSKHMENRTGKYIVFTSNIEALHEAMSHVEEWFAKVDHEPKVYYVYSCDAGAEKSFRAFIEDKDDSHLRLLFCIDALNDGIHLDDISGVILFRPTVSPIIYKQQIGRALSANKKTTPLIFDIVNNIKNLDGIDSIKEEMEAAISYYRYFGEGDGIVAEQFEIIDEVKDCRELFRQLEDSLSASWEYMFELAKRYYELNGDLEIEKSYRTKEGNYHLGDWIRTQRAIRKGTKTGLLSEEQIRKLDSIGMRWESMHDVSWTRHFEAYKKYVENALVLTKRSCV